MSMAPCKVIFSDDEVSTECGSVGLLHELAQLFQADLTLPRFGTDFIATRVNEFQKIFFTCR
jgi:hypothetical protein